MKMIYAGGKCNNHCFADYGGCNIHRTKEDKVLSMEEVAYQLGKSAAHDEQVFLYTPDLFSDLYFDSVFKQLPFKNGFNDPIFEHVYIAVNAGVRTLRDKIKDLIELCNRDIREVWLGVESAVPEIRTKYGKPSFTNQELISLTQEGNYIGINMCWYLVDGPEDNDASRIATYNLIKECKPYRVRIKELE